MTSNLLTTVFIGFSLAAAAVLLFLSASVEHPQVTEASTVEFELASTQGETIYRARCSSCHGTYDPRFYEYAEWRTLLLGSGCPGTPVDLTEREQTKIRDYLRGKAAGSADEAQKIRESERHKKVKALAVRGREVFKIRCAACHSHGLFVRTRTKEQWTANFQTGRPCHRDEKQEALPLKEELALRTFLVEQGAGTPKDAQVFKVLMEKGGAGVNVGSLDDFKEVNWVFDYEKGMAEAQRRGAPVLLNLTIEGGT